MGVPLVILLLVVCVQLQSIECISKNSELLFATVIYRHGDRYPYPTYATDPWNDVKFWPLGWGQLTNEGKRQHHELGTWLRNRYLKSVLAESYNADNINIQSTDIDRTLMSAYVNLDAMFPPSLTERFAPQIPWQPIPVHTVPQPWDSVLASTRPCAALDHFLHDAAVVNQTTPLVIENINLLSYIEKNSGTKATDLWGMVNVYDALLIENATNKELLEWTKLVFPEGEGEFRGKFTNLIGKIFQIQTCTPQVARLSYGRLLKEILQRMQSKADGTIVPAAQTMQVYSAHDITVSSILNMMGMYNGVRPPYASTVLIELYRTGSTASVQILYRNTTHVEPQPLNITNCGTLCPLADMFKLFGDLLPTGSFEEECQWPPANAISSFARSLSESSVDGVSGDDIVALYSGQQLL